MNKSKFKLEKLVIIEPLNAIVWEESVRTEAIRFVKLIYGHKTDGEHENVTKKIWEKRLSHVFGEEIFLFNLNRDLHGILFSYKGKKYCIEQRRKEPKYTVYMLTELATIATKEKKKEEWLTDEKKRKNEEYALYSKRFTWYPSSKPYVECYTIVGNPHTPWTDANLYHWGVRMSKTLGKEVILPKEVDSDLKEYSKKSRAYSSTGYGSWLSFKPSLFIFEFEFENRNYKVSNSSNLYEYLVEKFK